MYRFAIGFLRQAFSASSYSSCTSAGSLSWDDPLFMELHPEASLTSAVKTACISRQVGPPIHPAIFFATLNLKFLVGFMSNYPQFAGPLQANCQAELRSAPIQLAIFSAIRNRIVFSVIVSPFIIAGCAWLPDQPENIFGLPFRSFAPMVCNTAFGRIAASGRLPLRGQMANV